MSIVSKMSMVIIGLFHDRDRSLTFLSMQAEVNFLGQLHHPNLVKLIGYCIENDQRLLVYEFMARGSLENHLFRSEYKLSWISLA